MATTSSTGDWFHHFYQPTTTTTMTGTSPSDSTVISTTATANYPLGGSPSSEPATAAVPGRLTPAPEGRVSRPARRRSRASRRNPTTLLNTDTTNFRAMVQRYTGGAGAYPPFESPAAFNQVPMYGFGQHGSVVPGMISSPAMMDPEAAHLRQRLLQQYNVAAPVEEGGLDHGYSSAMGGGGENRRSGFMF